MELGFHPSVPSSWERAPCRMSGMETGRNRRRFLGMLPLQPGTVPIPRLSVMREHFLGFEAANANLFGCVFQNNYQITFGCAPFSSLLLRICPFLISSYFMWPNAHFLSPQLVPIGLLGSPEECVSTHQLATRDRILTMYWQSAAASLIPACGHAPTWASAYWWPSTSFWLKERDSW